MPLLRFGARLGVAAFLRAVGRRAAARVLDRVVERDAAGEHGGGANALGISNEVASFVLPTGTTLNKNGAAVYKAVTAVFLAHLYGVDLGAGRLLTIVLTTIVASSAGAGVPGSSLVTTLIVLNAIGLGRERRRRHRARRRHRSAARHVPDGGEHVQQSRRRRRGRARRGRAALRPRGHDGRTADDQREDPVGAVRAARCAPATSSICRVDRVVGTDGSGPMAIDYFERMGGTRAVRSVARASSRSITTRRPTRRRPRAFHERIRDVRDAPRRDGASTSATASAIRSSSSAGSSLPGDLRRRRRQPHGHVRRAQLLRDRRRVVGSRGGDDHRPDLAARAGVDPRDARPAARRRASPPRTSRSRSSAELGADGANYQAIEFAGDALRGAARSTIAWC